MNRKSQIIELFVSVTAPRQHFQAGWQPPVDVYRCRHGWVLKFDLAGIRPDDIQVRVQGQQLTVSGIRRDWRIHDWQEAHRMEIAYSRFERSVQLPESIDQAKVETDYRDGMFLVHLEMTQAPPPSGELPNVEFGDEPLTRY